MSNEQSKAATYNPSLLERAEMAFFVFVTVRLACATMRKISSEEIASEARRLHDAVYDAFLSDTGRTTAGPAAG